MLMEWQPKAGGHNLGDFVPSLFEHVFTPESWKAINEDRSRSYFLIGSVIAKDHLERSLNRGVKPVFFGCGYRGKPLPPYLLSEASFVGSRGAHTRAALRRHKIEVPVIGDPGCLLPIIVPRGRRGRASLLVPHINDADHYSPSDHGCDLLRSPLVADQRELRDLIRTISEARFVLTGSLHAAIIACAYGVPFGFFRADYLDCPPKWVDWASSISLSDSDVVFHHHASAAEAWYQGVHRKITRTRLHPLLRAARQIGRVRSSIAVRATLYDLKTATRRFVRRAS
jgi:hypothetical protein